MYRYPNIVKIEYKGEKRIKGSAFILPTLNSECMFMITAHHIFDYAPEINTDLITVTGQDRNTLSFDYDSDYYTAFIGENKVLFVRKYNESIQIITAYKS